MSTYKNIRIYAQLKPDDGGLQHLLSVQGIVGAKSAGRAVLANSLHMTLIHFGKVFDVHKNLEKVVGIAYDKYAECLERYMEKTEDTMPSVPFEATPKGFALFGAHACTLVAVYDVPESLRLAHISLLEELKQFLVSCGVRDVDSFLANDPNFVHARTLRPHITLFKGYAGELPVAELQPVLLHPMATVCPP